MHPDGAWHVRVQSQLAAMVIVSWLLVRTPGELLYGAGLASVTRYEVCSHQSDTGMACHPHPHQQEGLRKRRDTATFVIFNT